MENTKSYRQICTVNTKKSTFLLIITLKHKQNMVQVVKFQLPVILKRKQLTPQQFRYFFKIFLELLLFRIKCTVGNSIAFLSTPPKPVNQTSSRVQSHQPTLQHSSTYPDLAAHTLADLSAWYFTCRTRVL